MKLKKRLLNEKGFAIITSLILTVLTFCVFLGQYLWSDVVTFQKSGDNLKQCYPAFIKAFEYIANGQLLGVDVGTFNGATEFFYRSNLPNMYPFVWLAAIIMQIINERAVYLIFYICHFFFGIYFAQRLANKHFGINKWASLLFAIGVSRIIIIEVWYLSHFIIASLVCPLVYNSLEALHNTKKYKWILYSLPYVLAFTSGYITVSVILAVFALIMALLYGRLKYKKEIKTIIVRSIIPFAIALMASFLYCLQLLIYMKDVVQNASSSLFDTLYYQVNIKDLIQIFSGSFLSVEPMEQLELITLGVVWIIAIIWIVKYRLYQKTEASALLLCGGGLNTLILLIALGIITPIVLWFYTFVPVFGSMHLPLRYMIVTLPVLYLALSNCIQYVPDQKGNSIYKKVAVLAAFGIVLFSVLPRFVNLKIVNTDILILELLFLAVICFILYNYGIGRGFYVICCCAIFFPALNIFNNQNEVGIGKSVLEERSIVYNEKYQHALDNFIDDLAERELYKFAMYNQTESVPNFIPGNYEWYDLSKYNISNYMGYEVQLCTPKDYLQRFWWFNQMDWKYIVDTRGDFLVLDDASIEKSRDVLDEIVDWEKSNTYLDSSHRILKLKKFIPSYYTEGIPYQEDNVEVLDNGYFYSHDLSKDSELNFSTNNATYFQIRLDATKETDLAFLLYPNRYYHYFVDGQEVEPIVDEMKAYLPLNKGIHEVEVKYINKVGQLCNIVYTLYYILVGISVILFLCSKCKNIKLRQKNAI